jgi:hypothetical protein
MTIKPLGLKTGYGQPIDHLDAELQERIAILRETLDWQTNAFDRATIERLISLTNASPDPT